MKKFLWACLVIPCLVMSCKKDKPEDSGDPGTGPDPNPNPGTELPVGELRKAGTPIPGTLVQKEIGTAGGEIILGKVKFVFPAGALDKSVTFKVQQLLNTAPNGIDSIAYRFESTADIQTSKPVKMVYTFPRDEEGKPFIPGGEPNVLGGVAVHKTENGSTTGIYIKQPGKPVIDETAGTATQDFPLRISNGKFDIVNFLTYKLWINRKDGDTVSSTTVVVDDQIEYRVTKLGIDDIDDDLLVPIPPAEPVDGKKNSYITQIYINGAIAGSNELYGRVRSNNKDNHFTYQGPRVVPGGPDKTSKSFAVSCDILSVKGDVSKYYLVSNVKLINESTIIVQGRNVKNVRTAALEEPGWKHISISLNNMDNPGARATLSIHINNVFTGAGIYKLNYPVNTDVGVAASNGDDNWGMSAPDPTTNGLHQYATGSVTITAYDKINGILMGSYSVSLVRTINGKLERVPVSGKFLTPFTISQ